ncbi:MULTISPECIES: prohibitin family protein [unclassified Rhizobium]|jgi:regulator of protease activity HflC (stomatin/prohibitin superfamily)|uniref:prohibitin family protein n=1 Tax=unclassified Rhizobium TaxID=2613769 RepID=UPI000648E9F4|nr:MULTISPECIES: prohibitin family protein [unclassified Rhizobium]MBN8949385.1 prohibitin family protein [Rhizobium tropici]OJY75183.1 MAG: Band 7 protein [Rhizobium sp. 60-20]RKD70831.1 regulator of protease activity HflC (stomatin/prohibitin superfamily) [Rhizobium sp. WW_1]
MANREIDIASVASKGRVTALIGIIAVIAVLMLVFSSWYTIDQGERGVILRTGAMVGTAEPGLHFKLPWVETVIKIPVTQQVTYWTCQNGTSCQANEHQQMAAYSQDQQPADMRVTISWHVPADAVEHVYSEFGSLSNLESRLIARRAPQDVKTVFGKFTAASVIQNRAQFNTDVQAAIEAGIQGPVQIDSVQVENIDFSDAYENSIEQRMLAEVEVQKLRQNAEREKVQAQITVTQAQAAADARRADAQAQADAVKLQAQADAEAIQLRGDAEAKAIKARGDALRDNPNLIFLTQAEKWNGQLPTTMLPNASVPMLNLDPRQSPAAPAAEHE